MSTLQQELYRCQPFASARQEALVALLRTSDQLENQLLRFFRRSGLTLSQFNLLRILQLENRPLTCGEIAQRMVQIVPAITGIVDRLEQQHLVSRQRCTDDRRVVYVTLSAQGRKLIYRLEKPLGRFEHTATSHLTEKELAQLIGLLEKLRNSTAELAEQSTDENDDTTG